MGRAQARGGRALRLASPRSLRLVAIGLAAGLFSALFGVGGGIVVVPLLVLLAALPTRVATATSLGAITITAAAGAVVYGIEGKLDVAYAVLIGVPATIGALFGTSLQQRVTTTTLSYGFSVLLAAIGIWLLWP